MTTFYAASAIAIASAATIIVVGIYILTGGIL